MTRSFLLAVIFVSSLVLFWGATHSEGSELLQQSGKRVVGYLDDAILPRRWAILQDDTHPEAPHTLVPAGTSTEVTRSQGANELPNTSGQQKVVHAGDLLTLYDDSPTLHLQLAAVAIESATLGGKLRVRLVQGGTILSGVVLSPRRVKLQSSAEAFRKVQGTVR
jgi:hypothetical protein